MDVIQYGKYALYAIIAAGLIFVIYEIIRFFTSGPGQTISKLFGAGFAALSAMESAADKFLDLTKNCFQKGSQSTATQVGQCFGMIGILISAALVAYIFKGIGRGGKQISPESEAMKEYKQKMTDALVDTYAEKMTSEAVEEMAKKFGISKEKAAEIIKAQIDKAAASINEQKTKEIAAESGNKKDDAANNNAENQARAAEEDLQTIIEPLTPEEQQDAEQGADEFENELGAEI